NRRHLELTGLIGLFVNTLVLRTDLSGNPPFRELLQRVRRVCLDAYAHQDVPFEKLVEVLQPERDLSRSPLFQVLLSLQQHSPVTTHLQGMHVENLPLAASSAKFDLNLSLLESEQEVHVELEYNTDLFEAATIRRLLRQWQTLLEVIVLEPDTHVAQLS